VGAGQSHHVTLAQSLAGRGPSTASDARRLASTKTVELAFARRG
jgi:hypothetical protein